VPDNPAIKEMPLKESGFSKRFDAKKRLVTEKKAGKGK
jgi:hypothetical protein